MSSYKPIAMKQVDYLKTIFQLFLGFLTEAAVAELIQRCLLVNGGESVEQKWKRLLDLPPAELIELVLRDGDEEEKVKVLNVFLWRQAHGRIAPDLTVRYAFEESYYNWLIHRQMVANGYDWTSLRGTVVAQGEANQTYLAQIESQLNAFESRGVNDESLLLLLLNVIGPRISDYADLPGVMRFTRSLIECKDFEAMRWLSLPGFVLLVHDLSWPVEETWPLVQHLVSLEHNRSIFNYPGWILSIRMFGRPAKAELQRIEVPGGYDLLEAMATS